MSTTSGPEAAPTGRPRRRTRTLKARTFGWLRWLHIYTSMLSLLIVLFFALTGITLNHPEWTFGGGDRQTTLQGQLPAGWKGAAGVNWLVVDEVLRKAGLHGTAQDNRSDDQGATLSFRAPGYSADATISTSGAYRVNVDEQGLLAVLNDFHRGRDAGGGWAWAIDASGAFLALIALTGLGLLLYLKKVRLAALATMLGGAALMVILMHLAR